MPVYTRRQLRQSLGQYFLRDTLAGTTTGSWGATASLTVYDVQLSDLSMSGESMYLRSIVRLLTTTGYIQDARIATFNTGSGAFADADQLRYCSSLTFSIHSTTLPSSCS